MNLRTRLISLATVATLASLAFAAVQASKSLYISGKLASSSVIEVKGVAYVPVKDVAKALNMSVSKSARGLEISEAGGANMVKGQAGKVGDELFNGYARFQVLEVIRGKKYINRFSGDNQEVTPYPAGYDLVVIVCRVKNGTKESMPVGVLGGQFTSLTDDKEHSYQARSGGSLDTANRGPILLPGAATEFALTFDVPADTVLKDFVYDVLDLGGRNGSKPFRVSLK